MKKTILITGGSRGIGATTAILAAKKGYQVCINYLRNEKAALDVVNTINHLPPHAFVFPKFQRYLQAHLIYRKNPPP